MDIDDLIDDLSLGGTSWSLPTVAISDEPLKAADTYDDDDDNIFIGTINLRIAGKCYITDAHLNDEIKYCESPYDTNIIFHGKAKLSDNVQTLYNSLIHNGYNINRMINLPRYIYLPIHKKLKRYVKICLGRCSLASVVALIIQFYNTNITFEDIDFVDDPDDDSHDYYKIVTMDLNYGHSVTYRQLLDDTQYIYALTNQGILLLTE